MGSYRVCGFTRTFKVTEAQPPADVREAFAKFNYGGTTLTAEQLLRFLVEFQGEDVEISDAERIIKQIILRRHNLSKFTNHAFSLWDFLHYLFSDDLNPPIIDQVHQDMTAPLSHYFIFTGHNSYLTGNQLSSDCSDEPIIKSLQQGVRVIELDLWPNSTKDDVLVLHGRTLTTPVSLVKCLKSIKEHAFSTSPYPVVITLEDHLTSDLQAKVAKLVTQIFGEMLFYPEGEYLKEFPSPDALKYRIILSTKPPKEYLEEKNCIATGRDLTEEDAWGNEILDHKDEFFIHYKKDTDRKQDTHNGEDIIECDHRTQVLGTPDYKRLIAIHAKKKKGELKQALNLDSESVRRLSMSEQKLEKGTAHHATDFVRFTQRNLLRVYPKGTRFDSSNYNPLIGWIHGAQMVAFNMQGHGKYLWLMQGMFRSNGGCGYVKKPDILLPGVGNELPFDPRLQLSSRKRWRGYGKLLWLMQGMFRSNGGCGYVKKPDILLPGGRNMLPFDPRVQLPVRKRLRVRVYMGDGWRLDFDPTYFDAYSPPDFYVRIGIAGVAADTTMKKTKIMVDEWIPVWDKEFVFPLTVPELALLRIEVYEYDRSEKNDFGGQTCLPVWELRQGIRAVPLYDRKGEKYKSVKLLMEFQFV